MKIFAILALAIGTLLAAPFALAEFNNQGYVPPEYQTPPSGSETDDYAKPFCNCQDEEGRPYYAILGTACVEGSYNRNYDCRY